MMNFQPRKKALLILFIIIAAMFTANRLCARLLSGSKTERKLNKKIERLLNAARKQYDKGKVQQAIETYWKILEINPQETFAYLELGEIYYDLKIYDRAAELLEPGTKAASMEMDPDTVCYYYCVLTNTYLKMNQTGLASKALIKAAEASPKNPLPRKILGDIYLANNRIKSAYKAYKKALSFDPNYQPALEKIGELATRYKAEISNIQTPVGKKPSEPANREKPSAKTIVTEPDDENSDTAEFQDKPEADYTDTVVSSMEDRPMPLPAQSKSIAKAATSKVKPQQAPSAPAANPTNADRQQPTVATQPEPLIKNANEPADKASVDSAAIETQIDKLLAGTPEEKKIATEFFVKLGDRGIVELEELLFDSDPEVRILGIRALGAFKATYKDRVTTILEDSLDDPDPEVQKEIKIVLKSLLD
ncbi:MAG: hypothetical protein Kow0029_01930 [Candidatus Rifleibacteriota bacterium]